MRKPYLFHSLTAVLAVATVLVATSCSSTSGVPEGDQLFTGLKPIKYENYEKSDHFSTTQEEIEAALATAPNGALLGSSYYRSPFPYSLWIWNAFHGSRGIFARWMTKTFGKPPVLMSSVSPALRASVATDVVRRHGYFRGSVAYDTIIGKNPKTAKIAYTVNAGPLFTVDSMTYTGFPAEADSLIRTTMNEAKIRKGDPFDIAQLDAERNRLSTLFKNNGYFYYQPSFATFLADTLEQPLKARLQLKLADNLSPQATKKWYMGRVRIEFRKQYGETLHDTITHRYLQTLFNGKHPPVRTRVVLRDIKLRPRQLFSYDDYQQSADKVASTGLFSMVNFNFTPRDTTAACDTLDLTLSCVFDKPYDFYVEANATGKTTGRVGPELVVGFTKRNAFRGGEKLDINLHGSYEWQTNTPSGEKGSKLNSYEYGGDVSVEMPRLLLPWQKRRRYYTTPSTVLKASTNTLNRAKFFKRRIVSGELTYRFQPRETAIHEISPLTLEYEYMKNITEDFAKILNDNPYLMLSMQDQFIPKMKYTYTYSSPKTFRNPVFWQASVSESANILSLGYMAAGNKWNEKGKKMFKNPYAQFLKVETDYRKTWSLGTRSQLVAHLSGGIIWSYGNSESAPYSEQFYVGGANSIRAFTVRTIGPGTYHTDQTKLSYMDQTGDIKLQANLEFRNRLFGNLYGAAFIDAGNVWALRDDGYRHGGKFHLKNIADQMAVGTGIGLRYDLDFFVIRVDWGIGIHLPYDTGKRGYYNIPKFSDGQSIHLAIGYPF